MYKKRKIKLISFAFIAIGIAFSFGTTSWGHGDATTIVPATLNVKAGSELKVTVSGLIGAKTATFRLTGMSGKYKLGKFSISKDDFTKVLQIPADLPPGTYRLSVDGGKKSAKAVINVN